MNSDVSENALSERKFSILIVEDDDDFRDSCQRWLTRKGYDVVAVEGGSEGLHACLERDFDVGVFDMDMPGMSGLELLQRLKADQSNIEVVILTGQGTIETAVQAMKLGACDFLTKPCPMGELEHHLRLAYERAVLRRENERLKAVISRNVRQDQMIGDSPAMLQVARLVQRIAIDDGPVLITGESGTGKEVVAKSIQQQSPLSERPFVTVNCAALPESLVESELFGHHKGAFTGATAEKPGLFEIADGGTIFIDELGEMPLAIQPKLLRVLQDGSIRRVGSAQERHVKVRVIAATNRDLKQQVAEGKFREDLYYRVNVLPIHLPPLRERGEDVERLLFHFLPRGWTIESSALQVLKDYAWPGNVRELINFTHRAKILANGNEIRNDDLPSEFFDAFGGSADGTVTRGAVASKTPSHDLHELTRLHVMQVLEAVQGNKSRAAQQLGIHRRKLYRLLEQFERSNEPPEGSTQETWQAGELK